MTYCKHCGVDLPPKKQVRDDIKHNLIEYKGLYYSFDKNGYSIYDFGVKTDCQIYIAGGSGVENPEESAKKVIDEITIKIERK